MINQYVKIRCVLLFCIVLIPPQQISWKRLDQATERVSTLKAYFESGELTALYSVQLATHMLS